MKTLTKRENGTFPSLLSDFFDADRFFSSPLTKFDWSPSFPAVNIIENGNTFKIELAAPGLEKGDFKVNVEGNILTISAEKQEESSKEDERYTRQEFSYTTFSRSFRLPEEAQTGAIEGTYEGGILRLNVPKKEGARKEAARKIKIS